MKWRCPVASIKTLHKIPTIFAQFEILVVFATTRLLLKNSTNLLENTISVTNFRRIWWTHSQVTWLRLHHACVAHPLLTHVAAHTPPVEQRELGVTAAKAHLAVLQRVVQRFVLHRRIQLDLRHHPANASHLSKPVPGRWRRSALLSPWRPWDVAIGSMAVQLGPFSRCQNPALRYACRRAKAIGRLARGMRLHLQHPTRHLVYQSLRRAQHLAGRLAGSGGCAEEYGLAHVNGLREIRLLFITFDRELPRKFCARRAGRFWWTTVACANSFRRHRRSWWRTCDVLVTFSALAYLRHDLQPSSDCGTRLKQLQGVQSVVWTQ